MFICWCVADKGPEWLPDDVKRCAQPFALEIAPMDLDMAQPEVELRQQRLATLRRAAKIAREASEILCAEMRALSTRSQHLIALSDALIDRVHRQTRPRVVKKAEKTVDSS